MHGKKLSAMFLICGLSAAILTGCNNENENDSSSKSEKKEKKKTESAVIVDDTEKEVTPTEKVKKRDTPTPEPEIETPTPEPTEEPEEDYSDYFEWMWGTEIVGFNEKALMQKEIDLPDKTEGYAKDGKYKEITYENLEKIKINENLIYLNEGAFFKCPNLKEIIFPDNCQLKKYENWFDFDNHIEELNLPEGVEEIYGPINCAYLKKLVIPSTVKKISPRLYDFNAVEEKSTPKTDCIEVFTTGDIAADKDSVIGDLGWETSFKDIIDGKAEASKGNTLFDFNMLPEASEVMNFKPVEQKRIILHCDKGSYWDIVYSRIDYIEIVYN
ncbi:MAG: leucine-rich repeat protein [Oscillospiraceae bacterium]|nr:leucine-rich repeat protein [Oscillospiraceae bacterium]